MKDYLLKTFPANDLNKEILKSFVNQSPTSIFIRSISGMNVFDSHGTILYLIFNDHKDLRVYSITRRPGTRFEVEKEKIDDPYILLKIVHRVTYDRGPENDKLDFIEKATKFLNKNNQDNTVKQLLADFEELEINNLLNTSPPKTHNFKI